MSNIFRRVAAGLGALLFGAALTLHGSPAQAARSDCLAGYVCEWSGSAYSGSLYQWTQGYIWGLSGHCLNLSGSANNMANSIMNNGGRSVRFQWDACGGATAGVQLGPGQAASYADNDPYGRANRISSIVIL